MAGGGEHHSGQAHDHAADRTLEGDGTHPPADVHELVHLSERILHCHDAGGFRRHVTVLSDGHANRSSHHRRSVVDAVAHVQSLRPVGFLADDRELFFRSFLGLDLGDAYLVGQVTDFRFTISRDNHDALKLMLRPQMLDEGLPFGSRRVAQPKGRRVLAVDDHHAFQSTRNGRKVLPTEDVLRSEFVAAGDLDLLIGHGSPQPLTGTFAYLGCLPERNVLLFRLGENGPGQRMLGIEFEAGRQRKDLLLDAAWSDELFG